MEKLLLTIGVTALAVALVFPEGGSEREVGQVARSPAARLAPPVPTPVPRAGNGVARIVIPRASDGHFYADARINGARVRFLIDTGASSVVLSRADARAAGIPARPGEFTATGTTAAGDIALKPVALPRLALGPIVARDVPALIAERDIPISLLGQSFLERVRSVEISDDEMRLR